VTRRVDQVQHVVQTLVVVKHSTCLSLDCDASLSLYVESIQTLSISTFFYDTSDFQQAVAQRTLSMIDVGDNAEVAKALYRDGSYTCLELGSHLSDLRQSRGCCMEEAGIDVAMVGGGRVGCEIARSKASRKGAKEACLHLVLRSACPEESRTVVSWE
jgi:hypothetical protein